jgi:glutathione S-transferase
MKKKLTYFSICPFSRSIILLLDELKINYEKNEINDTKLLISKYHKKNSFYPIFEEFSISGDSENLFEKFETIDQIKNFQNLEKIKVSSFLAVNEYIFEKYGTQYKYLYGENFLDRIKINEMIWWLTQEFYENCLSTLIYEKYLKSFELHLIDHSPDSSKVRMAEMKLKELLLAAQIKIKENEFCATEIITYADFLLAAQISILDYMYLINWNFNLSYLKKWYLIMKSRPNFKNILKLRIMGFRPSEHYYLIDF